MAGDKIEVLLVGPPKPTIVNGLASLTLHRLGDAKDRDALLKEVGGRVRAIASSVTAEPIGAS
jgi:hydroxypyruvate reductase